MNFTNTGADNFIKQFKQTIYFAELEKNVNIMPDENIAQKQIRRRGQDFPGFNHIFADAFNFKPQESSKIKDESMKESSEIHEIRNISIPLSLKSAVTLSAKFPMSEAEWNRMMNMLTELKSELVESPPDIDEIKQESE